MEGTAPDCRPEGTAGAAVLVQRKETWMRYVLRGFWAMFDRAMGVRSQSEDEEEHFRSWGP